MQLEHLVSGCSMGGSIPLPLSAGLYPEAASWRQEWLGGPAIAAIDAIMRQPNTN